MIAQIIIEGFLMGGIYAISALGLSLIFGVMKITNFAHGAMMTIGMYVSYLTFRYFDLSPYASIPLSMIVLFIIGYLIQRYLVKKIEKSPSHNQLLLTLGLSIIFENGLLAIFGPDAKSDIFLNYSKIVNVFGMKLSLPKLISLGIVILVTALLYLFLYRTSVGRAVRATSENTDGALLMGVVVTKTKALAFGIGALCTGIAGTLLTTTMNIDPSVGSSFLLTCFVIAVLGSLGNLIGALISGFIIGIIESVTSYFFSGQISSIVIYLIFIIVLMVKPNGLFERRDQHE